MPASKTATGEQQTRLIIGAGIWLLSLLILFWFALLSVVLSTNTTFMFHAIVYGSIGVAGVVNLIAWLHYCIVVRHQVPPDPLADMQAMAEQINQLVPISARLEEADHALRHSLAQTLMDRADACQAAARLRMSDGSADHLAANVWRAAAGVVDPTAVLSRYRAATSVKDRAA